MQLCDSHYPYEGAEMKAKYEWVVAGFFEILIEVDIMRYYLLFLISNN